MHGCNCCYVINYLEMSNHYSTVKYGLWNFTSGIGLQHFSGICFSSLLKQSNHQEIEVILNQLCVDIKRDMNHNVYKTWPTSKLQ